MSRRELSDSELEAELGRRAALRGYRFVVERTADGAEWRAVFKADATPGTEDMAPEGIGVMSAESPDRRKALEDLLALDDLQRERDRF